MRTRSRKRAVLVAIRGTLLVMLAVILHALGYLAPLESLLSDVRVRHCQGHQPPPAPSLVHVDVDDNALSAIGHWPWPPATMARIVDEIARAGPKVLAMDVLFAEPTEGDNVLAASFRRLGCGLIPVSLHFDAPPAESRVRRLLMPLLTDAPERTQAQCLDLLRPAGVTAADLDPANSFATVREAAFSERIWRELVRAGGPSADPVAFGKALRRKLLPHDDPLMTGTVLGRLFDQVYAKRDLPRWAVRRFTLPVTIAGATPILAGQSEVAPIPALADAAGYSGFVDYLPESVEGTVRTVPLLARYGDRLVPHMDLVAACAVLGADVGQVRLTDGALTIPLPGGAVVVPVSVRDSPVVGRVGALMEVPLFGRPRQWQTMYDVPAHERPARHLSVDAVWQACEAADRLAANRASIHRMLQDAMELTDPAGARAYEAAPPTGEALRQLIRDKLDVLASYDDVFGDTFRQSAEGRAKLATARRIAALLPPTVEQADQFEAQLARQRAALREQLHEKAIFFGGTATSLLDVQPTSLFGSTPGVVVHGAVFNAILTGKMWRRTSPALGVAITAAIGLATLLLVMWLPPASAFLASVALGLAYLAVNGYVLFARHNLIVDAAGPAVAVAVVWAVMTLADFLTEITDRARITRRFRGYVDPKVVDYYVAHPEHERFDGERRELTIGFSDLAGFTTLTDQLGERVVPLLAEYVGHMIPLIRQRGTFDKQIGDGLCFFFGAPEPDAAHARHAVGTALAMHAALADFNDTLVARGHEPLGMRIGLATGKVIVGDAGTDEAHSYTTLGGTTNLAARLEGANKSFGTRTLATARTVELLGDDYLCRPIANLRVAGKLSCTVVYEPLCAAAEAGERDRQLAACTAAVFDAYRRGDFPACTAAAMAMEAAFGPSKFTRLYADRAAEPHDAQDHCDGQIVLSEK